MDSGGAGYARFRRSPTADAASSCRNSIIPESVPACMSHVPPSPLTPSPVSGLSERDVLLTLFDLGRQVASVIDFDELLQRIPELIGRLIQFDAFAVYLLDEKRQELKIAYAIG